MKKQASILVLALSLGACAGQDTRTPVTLQPLEAPNAAPWLTLAPTTPFDVPVHGVDGGVVLHPSPGVPDVVLAQLRHAAQPVYYTDLLIACSGLKVAMHVDNSDDAPSKAVLDASVHCRINARGFFSDHDYAAHPSLPVPADRDYARLFTALLDAAGSEMAAFLTRDIRNGRR
jgi:hypothetical protein